MHISQKTTGWNKLLVINFLIGAAGLQDRYTQPYANNYQLITAVSHQPSALISSIQLPPVRKGYKMVKTGGY